MSSNYFSNYQKEIDDKSIYSPESMESYSKTVLNQCLKWLSELEIAEYLPRKVKDKVIQQLERYIQDVEYYVKYPFAYANPKLKFKWNKADVLYFFHLLRENKQIEYQSNSVYGRFIDNSVEYYDGEQFLPLQDSRKRLSAFNQTVPTIVTESKKRLLEIFSNSDFYKE